MKILIIDESTVSRMFIRKELESIPDVELFEAKAGQEGIEMVEQLSPDLVTVSLFLKDMDGIAFTEKLRMTSKISDIPIVIITSSTDEALIKKAFDQGANEFFLKPFPKGALSQYVRSIFIEDRYLKNTQILVVDDSKPVKAIISSILKFKGATVLEASDGKRAIEVLRNNPQIDIVITDYIMPNMDGIEFCTFVRKNMKLIDLPLLILTAFGEQDTVLKALKAGANDYLIKPFSREELLARIQNHIRLVHFNQQLKDEIKARTLAEMNLQKAYQNIKEHQNLLLEELEQARETQKSILPETMPIIEGAKIVCKYTPMEHIGGDFYDVFELENNKFGIMLADVTGHGVPAALICFMASGIFTDSAKSETSTEKVMNSANGALHGNLQEGKFVTMFYAIYDASKQTLTYTNAAHPEALVIRHSNQEVIELNTGGMFLGPFPNEMTGYEEKTFQLFPGDKVLLYTDAVVEVLNEREEMLGTKRLIPFLKQKSGLPISEILEEVYNYGLFYSGRKNYDDDCTLLGLEIS